MKKNDLGKRIRSSQTLLLISGGAVLLLGMTLVLVWWADVVSLFRGMAGMILAVGGLVVLSQVKK